MNDADNTTMIHLHVELDIELPAGDVSGFIADCNHALGPLQIRYRKCGSGLALASNFAAAALEACPPPAVPPPNEEGALGSGLEGCEQEIDPEATHALPPPKAGRRR